MLIVRSIAKKLTKKRPKAVSMFSGCGGIDLGFVRAGFDVVWSNDINADACATYRRNIGEIHEGDVFNFAPPKVKNLDVLVAGFPCQPFSNAGKRLGILDTRGKLFETCLSYVESLSPKIVMFENVRGLISIKNEHGDRLIEEICTRLTSIGYEVRFKLVNSADFSVPQKRIRIVILAVRKDFSPNGFGFPESVPEGDLTLEACLDVPEDAPNQKDFLRLNPQALYLGSFVPEGGSWKDIPYECLPDRLKKIRDDMKKYRWPNFYRRFARDEISGTITAAFKPENAGVWHPILDRVLSAREIARIQSFPDDFIFTGSSVKAIYEMIGNAVPPKLSETFALHIHKILRGQDTRNKSALRYSDLNLGLRPIRPTDPEILFDGVHNGQKSAKLNLFNEVNLTADQAEVM